MVINIRFGVPVHKFFGKFFEIFVKIAIKPRAGRPKCCELLIELLNELQFQFVIDIHHSIRIVIDFEFHVSLNASVDVLDNEGGFRAGEEGNIVYWVII